MASLSNKKRKSDFPDTLDEFGYHFNEAGVLESIKSGEKFEFNVKEDDHPYNQRHYEALGDVITQHIYGLLEDDCQLDRLPIPKKENAPDPKSFMFASKDAFTNPDALLILINGSGVVRAGQWARRLIINDSLNAGSQIPFIKRGQKEGYGIIVLNTNEITHSTDSKKIPLKHSETPTKHASYVWTNYIKDSAAKKICIVAHSFGGCVTLDLLNEFSEDFLQRVVGIAFTDSVHFLKNFNHFNFLTKICRNWVTSALPLDSPVKRKKDVPCVSAGVTTHEMTSWSSFKSIFDFFTKQKESNLIYDNEDEKVEDNKEKDASETEDENPTK